jgi:hypothetical protein
MGGSVARTTEMRRAYKIFLGNINVKDLLGNLGVQGRITIKADHKQVLR